MRTNARYDAEPLLSALKTVFGAWCQECMIDHALASMGSEGGQGSESRKSLAAIVSTLVSGVRTYADICARMLTYADEC
jgi:hypothetical protein